MKKIMLVLGILVVIVGIIFLSLPHIENARTNLIEESVKQQSKESGSTESSESESEVTSELIPESEPEIESTPEFVSEIKPEPIPEFYLGGFVGVNTEDDDGFKEAIHYMTHQKVYAETQFGAIEVTAENIDKMLSILDRAEYEEVDYYREVLTSWKNGDFSNAVDVHNKIYREEDGNTGFATRLLTTEEEQRFVELNFR